MHTDTIFHIVLIVFAKYYEHWVDHVWWNYSSPNLARFFSETLICANWHLEMYTYLLTYRYFLRAKLKIINLQYLRNLLSDHDEIFHQYANCGCKNAERLKFAYFKYSRWRTAVIVGIENLQSVTVRLIATKLCRHADCEYKTCG